MILTDQSNQVRVLTWNLWWRFGPWRRRREAIAAVLAEAQPDLCGLQEVWASPGEHLAALLADQLGMHWTWTASPAPERWQQRLGDPTMQVGNAVLSRWPITDQATQPLPTGASADNDGRTVLFAQVQTPTGPVPFFTTQLTSTIGQSWVRCQQVATLCRFVAAHAGPGFPPVLTGDLNAEPDADEVRLLGGHKTAPVVPGLVLVDAWRYADPMAPGWTWTGTTRTSRPPGTQRPDRLRAGRAAHGRRRRPHPVGPADRRPARGWHLALQLLSGRRPTAQTPAPGTGPAAAHPIATAARARRAGDPAPTGRRTAAMRPASPARSRWGTRRRRRGAHGRRSAHAAD